MLWPQFRKGHREADDDTSGCRGLNELWVIAFRPFDGKIPRMTSGQPWRGGWKMSAHAKRHFSISFVHTCTYVLRLGAPQGPSASHRLAHSPLYHNSLRPSEFCYFNERSISSPKASRRMRYLFCVTLHWRWGTTCRARMNICCNFKEY